MLNAAHAVFLNPTRFRPGPAAWCPRNAVAAVLTPADILVDLDVSTKTEAIAALSHFIASRHGLLDNAVRTSLARREAVGSTGLGSGVAIPHARVSGLACTIAAFARTRIPVPFDAPDNKPVSDLLVLLVPKEANDEHLQLLAQAAEMFCDPSFRERVRGCVDAAHVHATIAGWR